MNKAELRKQALDHRRTLSNDWQRFYSQQLAETFFEQVDLSQVNVLSVFLPIVNKNEPDTWLLIHRVWRDYPHITTVCPVANREDHSLRHAAFDHTTVLTPNAWGIPEPVLAEEVSPQDIDMVLVPLLVFDFQGHRLGYGKGFYDRFLAQVRPDCRKVGYTFAKQPVERIPIEETDVALNACVSPGRYHLFSGVAV